MCFHRAKLMGMLSRNLRDQSKVLLGKQVMSLENTATGVTVRCADESVYSGSIVIGADGVHSTVRRLMNDAVGKTDEPFSSAYRGLYGYASRSPELEAETLYETHSANLTIQLIVAEAQQHFLVYERMERETKDRTRYLPEDEDKMAQRFADVRFPGREEGQWVTLGQVWANKKWSAMGNLDEGIVARWHQGRCVLVGDAAHKMTPNTGFGMNSGMQGVVQLVNRLRTLLHQTSSPAEPTPEQLTKVFGEYQQARMANSKEAVDVSALYTRLVAWNNPVWRFADQYVLPYVKGDNTSLNLLMSPIVQKGVALDFIEEKGFKAGTYRYHTPPSALKPLTSVA